jgi:hypothetical protein
MGDSPPIAIYQPGPPVVLVPKLPALAATRLGLAGINSTQAIKADLFTDFNIYKILAFYIFLRFLLEGDKQTSFPSIPSRLCFYTVPTPTLTRSVFCFLASTLCKMLNHRLDCRRQGLKVGEHRSVGDEYGSKIGTL